MLEGLALAVHSCVGCGTRSHGVCLDELGRCPTMGCEESYRWVEETASPQARLLRALMGLQETVAYGTAFDDATRAAREKVDALAADLPHDEVERIREQARKLRSFASLQEEMVREQEESDRLMAQAEPRTGQPLMTPEELRHCLLALILLVVLVLVHILMEFR